MASTRCRGALAFAFLVLLVAGLAGSCGAPGLPAPAAPGVVGAQDTVSQDLRPSPGGRRVGAYREEGELPEVAAGVVAAYRDEGDCRMRQAGYVDLAGNVWACVVQGPGWVDLCVVSQREGEAASSVRTLRWEVDDWKDVCDVRE